MIDADQRHDVVEMIEHVVEAGVGIRAVFGGEQRIKIAPEVFVGNVGMFDPIGFAGLAARAAVGACFVGDERRTEVDHDYPAVVG